MIIYLLILLIIQIMYSRVPNKRPVQISVLGRQFLKIHNRPVPYKRPGPIFFKK